MIHIIQCLCPERHCVLAVAYDDAETSGEAAMQMFKSIVLLATDGGGLNPWCGICHSTEWTYEDGITRFRTFAEAQPHLEQNQRDQTATRALIDQAKAQRN